MILGTIEGKSTTSNFVFHAKEEPNNFEYVQVYHQVYDFVLCQIVEIAKTVDKTTAYCQIIGYKDDDGRIKRPRIPFELGAEVLRAEDEFISAVISLPEQQDNSPHAVIGQLDGRSIPVALDLNNVLTKHVAVLAKSGAGKSYTVGVLLEEITERNVPLVIIDPHGEYAGLAQENTSEKEIERMSLFGVTPQKYVIAEYGDNKLLPHVRPLRLPTKLSAQELSHLLPGKLSANQQAILYSALKNLQEVTFDSLLFELEAEESPAKFNIINTVDYLRSLPIFSSAATPYNELVKPGQATIINLKGINPDVQEIIVYKLCKDLFMLRKQNKISPFFMVMEEAHNYCPERSFGETKASKIIRDIASEGRKFGLGLCVVSQRPARVDKSVLSQCSTQIILKVTNPNDLKALSQSVEGITAEAEKEVKNLPIGTALVTGITDVPLFVTIRPRKTQHGGHAIDILNGAVPDESTLLDKMDDFQGQELLPLIKPSITPRDLEVMSEEPLTGISTVLTPAFQLVCKEGEQTYKLLVDRVSGHIIADKDSLQLKRLPALDKLSPRELTILQQVFSQGVVSAAVLASSIGGSLSLDEEVAPLLEQGYLRLQDDAYVVSDEYIFTRLSKVATFDEIAFESLAFQEKRPAHVSIDEVKNSLEKFTSIIDFHECFVVQYIPLKGGDVA